MVNKWLTPARDFLNPVAILVAPPRSGTISAVFHGLSLVRIPARS